MYVENDEQADERARLVALELLVCELFRRHLMGSGDPDREIEGTRERIARENQPVFTAAVPEMVSDHLERLLDQAQAMTR